MKTLKEVWEWYEDIREIFYISSQVVTPTVLSPSTIPGIGHFQSKTVNEVRQTITNRRSALDDFVIVALWSQFEVALNEHVEKYRDIIIAAELDSFKADIIDFRLSVKRSGYWSLVDTLDLYKSFMPSSTVGSIHEIYNYRNWIAHGKVKKKPKNVILVDAYNLLDSFLFGIHSFYP